MSLRFFYSLVRRVIDVLGRRLCSRLENEVEIAVLRVGCQNSITPLTVEFAGACRCSRCEF
jgi:hypothetical protein